MKDINKVMPKVPNMRWGALLNKYPTNDKVKQMNKIFPHNGRWHTVFEEQDQVFVDGVRIWKKNMNAWTWNLSARVTKTIKLNSPSWETLVQFWCIFQKRIKQAGLLVRKLEDSQSLLNEAYDLCQEGEYMLALEYYDLVLFKNPKNLMALIDKGVTLQNLGKYRKAIKCYDEALSLSPKNKTTLVNKGSALHSRGKYRDAIDCYDAALRIDSKYAMAIVYKGLALGELGFLKQAIKCFNDALRIDKKYDLALSNKALALQLLKANDKLKPKLQKP